MRIREAAERDVPLILRFIRELAEYEKLPDECVATRSLGARPMDEWTVFRLIV